MYTEFQPENLKGGGLLGISGCVWEHNIKTDFKDYVIVGRGLDYAGSG